MLSALHPALTLLFCRRHSQALHLLAPLFPPGNNSARTRVVKRLTAMAMPDPDLNAELLRLRLIGQETAELLPQLLEQLRAAADTGHGPMVLGPLPRA